MSEIGNGWLVAFNLDGGLLGRFLTFRRFDWIELLVADQVTDVIGFLACMSDGVFRFVMATERVSLRITIDEVIQNECEGAARRDPSSKAAESLCRNKILIPMVEAGGF